MYNLKINVTDLISSKKNWNWNVVSVFCFVLVDVKKQEKKEVCSRQRPLILFCFFNRENCWQIKDEANNRHHNRAVSLCVTGSGFRIVLKFSSPQFCFLCSPPNSHFKSPKCSRIFGPWFRRWWVGLGVRGSGSPCSSFPVSFNLEASPQLLVDCSALCDPDKDPSKQTRPSPRCREHPVFTFYLRRSQKASCSPNGNGDTLISSSPCCWERRGTAADETDSGSSALECGLDFVRSVKAKLIPFCFCLGLNPTVIMAESLCYTRVQVCISRCFKIDFFFFFLLPDLCNWLYSREQPSYRLECCPSLASPHPNPPFFILPQTNQ